MYIIFSVLNNPEQVQLCSIVVNVKTRADYLGVLYEVYYILAPVRIFMENLLKKNT